MAAYVGVSPKYGYADGIIPLYTPDAPLKCERHSWVTHRNAATDYFLEFRLPVVPPPRHPPPPQQLLAPFVVSPRLAQTARERTLPQRGEGIQSPLRGRMKPEEARPWIPATLPRRARLTTPAPSLAPPPTEANEGRDGPPQLPIEDVDE